MFRCSAQENVTVRFFAEGDPAGPGGEVKLLKRHPLNDRDQRDTRERYKRIIKKHGLYKGARSEVVVVPA
eukprot:4729462-Pyramimonas_sp.AAC.1